MENRFAKAVEMSEQKAQVMNTTEKFIFGGGVTFKTPGLVDQVESKVRELSVFAGEFPEFEVARYSQEAQAFGLLQLMASQLTLVNMNYY